MYLERKRLNLKLARRKLTLSELAEVSHVSLSTISASLNKTSQIRPKNIGKIADALDCNVEDIIAKEEEE